MSKYGDVDLDVAVLDQSTLPPEKSYREALDDFIQLEKPDVLYLAADEYARYVQEGMLSSLEPYIQADHYELSGMQSSIIDFLKELGGGQLYGLSPTFYNAALYYNADLFKQYGITPPHDNMTWQEILDLAARFPADGGEQHRIYGLSVPFVQTIDDLVAKIANTQGLSAVNPKTMQVTLNTDSWKSVWNMAINGAQSGALYLPETPFYGGSQQDFLDHDLFVQGRVAMQLDDAGFMQVLAGLTKTLPDYKAFQFDTVTGPVDPLDRSSSRDMEVGRIFAIRAGTPNMEAAWDFVKYVNSDDYAVIKARVFNSNLLTRMDHYNENRLQAFYKLHPLMVDYSRQAEIPDTFTERFNALISTEMRKAARKETSLEEALNHVSKSGQALLDEALAKQKKR